MAECGFCSIPNRPPSVFSFDIPWPGSLIQQAVTSHHPPARPWTCTPRTSRELGPTAVWILGPRMELCRVCFLHLPVPCRFWCSRVQSCLALGSSAHHPLHRGEDLCTGPRPSIGRCSRRRAYYSGCDSCRRTLAASPCDCTQFPSGISHPSTSYCVLYQGTCSAQQHPARPARSAMHTLI